jgi:hypothetical protein
MKNKYKLTPGRIYRTERPQRVKNQGIVVFNDRRITSVDFVNDVVVYECAHWGEGRTDTVSGFLRWAKRDVTDKVPKGCWQPFPLWHLPGGNNLTKLPENTQIANSL